MSNKPEAIGILETQGLTAILEATAATLNAVNIPLVGKEKIGAADVTVIVPGGDGRRNQGGRPTRQTHRVACDRPVA